MIPVFYSPNTTDFSSFGLGVLTDTISCEVTEERNGVFECLLKYPVSGQHYGLITKECIIKAKPNDTEADQAFRIYRITKPLNGIVMLYEVYKNEKYAKIAKKICAFALPLLLIFFLADTFFKPNYNIWGNIRIVSSLFGFPVLIISSLMFTPVKRFLSLRPFAFLGKISTSIYLWHFPVQGLMMILHKSFGIFDFRRVYVMIIYIVLSLAVATVSNIFLEKTLGKRISPIIDELFGVHKIKNAV